MNLLIKIVMLCGLMTSVGYADQKPTAPAAVVKNTVKAATAKTMDRDTVCTRCHDENENKPILSIYQTAHGNKADSRTPSCQSCHGESEAHLKGDSKEGHKPPPDFTFAEKSKTYPASPAESRNGQCMNCHKGGLRTHWAGSQHQTQGLACNSCHTVHTPKDKVLAKPTQPEVCFACHKEQRAQIHKFSHHPIGEGKVACSDCHNPHGSAGSKLLKKNTTTETCFTCHAEKRGPYLWEHQPVTEDCTNCHTPHGSNITPLLKSRPPFMCDECHDGPHNSKAPAAGNAAGWQGGLANTVNPSTSYTGRACMNCHSMVHGSNHPAGALLQR